MIWAITGYSINNILSPPLGIPNEVYLYFLKSFFSWETVWPRAGVGGSQVKPVNPAQLIGSLYFFNTLNCIRGSNMSGIATAYVLNRAESRMELKILFFKKITKSEWKGFPKVNT